LRHDHGLGATDDKSKILTIIENKTPILLHAVLKEIHECTAVAERGSEVAHLNEAVAVYCAALPPA
jgi:hypothetical protein